MKKKMNKIAKFLAVASMTTCLPISAQADIFSDFLDIATFGVYGMAQAEEAKANAYSAQVEKFNAFASYLGNTQPLIQNGWSAMSGGSVVNTVGYIFSNNQLNTFYYNIPMIYNSDFDGLKQTMETSLNNTFVIANTSPQVISYVEAPQPMVSIQNSSSITFSGAALSYKGLVGVSNVSSNGVVGNIVIQPSNPVDLSQAIITGGDLLITDAPTMPPMSSNVALGSVNVNTFGLSGGVPVVTQSITTGSANIDMNQGMFEANVMNVTNNFNLVTNAPQDTVNIPVLSVGGNLNIQNAGQMQYGNITAGGDIVISNSNTAQTFQTNAITSNNGKVNITIPGNTQLQFGTITGGTGVSINTNSPMGIQSQSIMSTNGDIILQGNPAAMQAQLSIQQLTGNGNIVVTDLSGNFGTISNNGTMTFAVDNNSNAQPLQIQSLNTGALSITNYNAVQIAAVTASSINHTVTNNNGAQLNLMNANVGGNILINAGGGAQQQVMLSFIGINNVGSIGSSGNPVPIMAGQGNTDMLILSGDVYTGSRANNMRGLANSGIVAAQKNMSLYGDYHGSNQAVLQLVSTAGTPVTLTHYGDASLRGSIQIYNGPNGNSSYVNQGGNVSISMYQPVQLIFTHFPTFGVQNTMFDLTKAATINGQPVNAQTFSALNKSVLSGNTFFDLNLNGDGTLSASPVTSGTVYNTFSQNNITPGALTYLQSNLLNEINSNTRSSNLAPILLEFGYMNSDEQVQYLEAQGNVTVEHLSAAQGEVSQANSNMVNSRLNMLPPSGVTVADSSEGGVAAGCEMSDSKKLGVWISGFDGIANQKTRKSAHGYKTHTYGGILGLDTALDDSTIIGMLGNVTNSKMKHQGVKKGDITKADTYMFGVYGSRELGNNWMMQGNITIGKTYSKSYEKQIVRGGSVTSNSKYNAMLYTTEVLGGYNYNVSDRVTVTPMFGAKYSLSGKTHYSDKGNPLVTRSVSVGRKASFSGVLGAHAKMSHDMQKAKLVTGLNASVEYDFINKAASPRVSIGGNNTAVVGTTKPVRTLYNLGADVVAHVGAMEYGIRYDAKLAEKYVGHQGAIKLRVNF